MPPLSQLAQNPYPMNTLPWARQEVARAYQTYLGREAGEADYNAHLGGNTLSGWRNVKAALDTIMNSDEAKNYANRQNQNTTAGAGATPPPDGGTGTGNTGDAGPTSNTREWRDQLRGEASGRGAKSAMHGFREGDYDGDTKARTSVKNTFATIARDYDATPEGLRQLVQDPRFKQAFPNARIVEHPTGDQIDFGDTLSDFESGERVGIVDVGLSFDGTTNTGKGWWWGPKGGATSTTSASSAGSTPTTTPPPSTSAPAPDVGITDPTTPLAVDTQPLISDLAYRYANGEFR